jgi:hypothetical protein
MSILKMREKILSRQRASGSTHQTKRVAAYTILSWAGMFIHNSIELPMLSLLSPENMGPLLVSIILYFFWWLRPQQNFFVIAILGWTLLHFVVGGILSVLPLTIWPFIPEQSLTHYFAHIIYSGAQIPLMVLMISLLTQPGKERRTS